ncbi:RsmB/NOP family class I SAM-dependent RNA methyltransferase [Falsirhodobacter halotolerans]|uniref:RsmB/NOP family class I SAM-dependent RNA methyltransferase n=1 Tax=Falsirhodobacter halotolerans TaxID=1146892 RepID=UPI001FCF82B1|nr:transcription antitermination factor NusB [Falsirhodobacter halotolerans]MCJ8140722.1 methyltransferase domain-containing protein [Falsirhodobacter halotolerans]
MAVEGFRARHAAVQLLGAVLSEGALLSQIATLPNGPLEALGPADRARAQRLAAMTLRHLEQADAVLDPHIRRAPPRLVQNALRLAVVEMAVEGAAAHGAVNAAVDIVRHGRKTAHQAGFTNAVLRKVKADFSGLPPQRLPRWLRQPLVHTYGREAVSMMEAVQAKAPPIDLTLKAAATAIPEGTRLSTGGLRLPAGTQVSALPGYETGDWWVQDAAAAMAVRYLAPRAGERIADLCAAPGGKTLQLADAGAEVTAVDISAPRLARLQENLARTGLAARVVTGDVLTFSDGPFDAILLDAPCSATGTIRRHPDLPFVKTGEEVAGLVDLQARMIDHALTLLAPGGRLVFCTCSLLPEEGEDQLAAALTRHPDLTVLPPPEGTDPAWHAPQGGLRLRPDVNAEAGGMDGFFIAGVARKTG